MNNFWLFLKATPKASLMIPLVLLLQILKRVGLCPVGLDEKLISDIIDLLTAVAGLYGLFHAAKGQWPASPPTQPPIPPAA